MTLREGAACGLDRGEARVGLVLAGGSFALGVVGGCIAGEVDVGEVALLAGHDGIAHAGGLAHENNQKAGRERVERAAVPDLDALGCAAALQPASDDRADIHRGEAEGFVDEQDAGRARGGVHGAASAMASEMRLPLL